MIAVVGIVAGVISFFSLPLFQDGGGDGQQITPPTTVDAVEVPDVEVHVVDLVGDDRPEFVQIDGEVLPLAEQKTWLDRWGVPVGGFLITGLFAIAAALLQRSSSGKETDARLLRIEQLLAAAQPTTPSSSRTSRRQR